MKPLLTGRNIHGSVLLINCLAIVFHTNFNTTFVLIYHITCSTAGTYEAVKLRFLLDMTRSVRFQITYRVTYAKITRDGLPVKFWLKGFQDSVPSIRASISLPTLFKNKTLPDQRARSNPRVWLAC